MQMYKVELKALDSSVNTKKYVTLKLSAANVKEAGSAAVMFLELMTHRAFEVLLVRRIKPEVMSMFNLGDA